MIKKVTGILFSIFVLGCLFAAYRNYPPTDSAAMAGWVQAIGSLAAIGLAIALQYSANSLGARQADRFARGFCGTLILAFTALAECCRKKDFHGFVVQRRVIEDALELGRQLQFVTMAPNLLGVVFTFRAMTIEALYETANHTESDDWTEMTELCEGTVAISNKLFLNATGIKSSRAAATATKATT